MWPDRQATPEKNNRLPTHRTQVSLPAAQRACAQNAAEERCNQCQQSTEEECPHHGLGVGRYLLGCLLGLLLCFLDALAHLLLCSINERIYLLLGESSVGSEHCFGTVRITSDQQTNHTNKQTTKKLIQGLTHLF